MTPILRYDDPLNDGSVSVVLDTLVTSRMLVQANSGGGKSTALRQLLEETHGKLPHLVLDPEGEFVSLRERFPYVHAAAKGGDVEAHPKSAALLCRRLMEHGASAVLDLYDLRLPDRRLFVANFLTALMSLPRALWRPTLVVLDEAHKYCPEKGHGESVSTEPEIDVASQGRKRGFVAVLATQRLSKLHKDAAAELLNRLVGRTGLDVDMRRAGDDLGFDKDQRMSLKRLAPGEFYAYGPAIANEVVKVKIPRGVTGQGAATIGAAPPPPPPALADVLASLSDLPKQAAAEAQELETLRAEVARLKREAAAKPLMVNRSGPTLAEIEQDRANAVARAVKAFGDRVGVEHRERAHTLAHELDLIATRVRAMGDTTRTFQVNGKDGLPLVTVTGIGAPPVANGSPSVDADAGKVELATAVDAALAPKNVSRLAVVKETTFGVTPGSGREQLMREQLQRFAVRSQQDAVGRPVRDVPEVKGAPAKIMAALGLLRELGLLPANKQTVAIFAGYAIGGTFSNYLGSLRSHGLLSYPSKGQVDLTEAGADHPASSVRSFTSWDELHALCVEKAGGASGRILRALLDWPVREVTREQVAEITGYAIGGTFANYLGRLRTMGFIVYPAPGKVRLADTLFPEGLS